MEHQLYAGKVLLVTGGASGIGRQSCIQAARRGAAVVIADINDGEELAAELRREGARARAFRVDVGDEDSVRTLLAEIEQEFGRLDALVSAAGIPGLRASLLDYPTEEFERVLRVNLLGTVHACKHAVPVMERSGGGRIVNIASFAGETGFPINPAYAASKAAVISITRSLAADLAIRRSPVQLTALCPGWIDTPLLDDLKRDPARLRALCDSVPGGRLGSTEEVATTALWLALEAPAYLNGETIRLDGGLMSSSPTHVAMLRSR